MWYLENRPIQSIEELPNPELLFGFVYKITNTITGKFYIGKKQVISRTKKKLTKAELSSDKRKKTYKHVTKETDWKTYYGSSKTLLADLEVYGKENFRREIIDIACTKKYLTWAEVEQQMKHDVLRRESYNDNVMGRFYRKDMDTKC